jgi:branched-chain amino acid transport system ATP-binding protein
VSALLQLNDVEARYGPVKALQGISLEVGQSEMVAVLGANGAGKTTTLRAISGTVRRTGDVRFDGARLPRRPDAVARAGIAHVPEGRGTFSELSVWENLRLGAYTRRGSMKEDAQYVFKYFPRLEERKNQQAGTLSGGEQQMLALGRAIMARPKLVLLDEPSLGLAPLLVKEIFDRLGRMMADDGTAVLVVEQNAVLALAHASEELRANESVRRSYLGY